MVQSKEHLRRLFDNVLETGDVPTLNTLFRNGNNGALRRHLFNEPVFAGHTALQKASFMGNSDVCVALLELGATLETPGRHGRTALHTAVMGGDVETVNVLLLACADSLARDNDALYPIDYADDEEIRGMIMADMEKKGATELVELYRTGRLRRMLSSERGIQILTQTSIVQSRENEPIARQSSKEGWNVTIFHSVDMTVFESTDNKRCSQSSSADEGIEEDGEVDPLNSSSYFQIV